MFSVTNFIERQTCLSTEASTSSTTFGNNNNNNNQNRNNNNRNYPSAPNNNNRNNNRNSSPNNDKTDTSSYIKIRSKASEKKCLTLLENEKNQQGDKRNKVGLKNCQSSYTAKQSWKLNSKTAYMHSAHDETKCLVPKLDNGDEGNKRTRLIVDTCPYYTKKKYQWRFTDDGLVINRKKDFDGTPLVIKASRGLKKNAQSEKILMIPTLSPYSNGNKFFEWSIITINK